MNMTLQVVQCANLGGVRLVFAARDYLQPERTGMQPREMQLLIEVLLVCLFITPVIQLKWLILS